MDNIVVVYASRYDFVNEKNGERIKGCKVKYFLSDGENSENKVGHDIMESKAPYELFSAIKAHRLPALFNADFRQKAGFKNQPELSLVRATFVREIEMFDQEQSV